MKKVYLIQNEFNQFFTGVDYDGTGEPIFDDCTQFGAVKFESYESALNRLVELANDTKINKDHLYRITDWFVLP